MARPSSPTGAVNGWTFIRSRPALRRGIGREAFIWSNDRSQEAARTIKHRAAASASQGCAFIGGKLLATLPDVLVRLGCGDLHAMDRADSADPVLACASAPMAAGSCTNGEDAQADVPTYAT